MKKLRRLFSVNVNRLRGVKLLQPVIMLCMITGCTPGAKEDEAANQRANIVVEAKQSVATKSEVAVFATIVDATRDGTWLGGSPPINKRASGVDTFYKIAKDKLSNHLKVTLRFEGITAEDAYISFSAIDGATLLPEQQTKWRLKSNEVSEVSFEVVVPESVSYLTLYTYQNGQGASRAFLLEETQLR